MKTGKKRKYEVLRKLVKAHRIPYKPLAESYGMYKYETVLHIMMGRRTGSERFWKYVKEVVINWRKLFKKIEAVETELVEEAA